MAKNKRSVKYENDSSALSFFDLFDDIFKDVNIVNNNNKVKNNKNNNNAKVNKVNKNNNNNKIDELDAIKQVIDSNDIEAPETLEALKILNEFADEHIEKQERNAIINNVESLDFLISKENLPESLKDRYAINIEVIKKLNKITTKTKISKADLSKFAKYTGWGGLSEKFQDDTKSNEQLKKLLKEGYKEAKESTLTSFYTPLYIIKFIFKALSRFGFEKGKILDPSTGVGRFLGAMSEDMYYKSNITALEPDKTTYKIANLLYKESNVINQRFECMDFDDNSFDLVTSNIPFGNFSVYDEFDKDLNDMKANIHDYFFLKAIKKTRIGGLIAFVTSTSTLDNKNHADFREHIANQCNFLGAIRLPVGTFSDTKVGTDIIFLQKTGTKNTLDGFISVITDDTGISMNEYFSNHREMIVGTPQLDKNQYGQTVTIVKGDISSKILEKQLKYLPKDIYEAKDDDSYMFKEEEIIEYYDDDIRKDEIVLYNDKIVHRQGNKLIPVTFKGSRYDKLYQYIKIKEDYKKLINIQLEKKIDNDLFIKTQNDINKKYDKFVKEYGFINSLGNKRILIEDIYYYNIATLESYDYKTGLYTKADILNKRFIQNSDFKVETINDAYTASFFNLGKLDLNYIHSLTKHEFIEDTIKDLCDNNLICYDVINKQYLPRLEFLSGNVKAKLSLNEDMLKEKIEYKKGDLEEKELQKTLYEIDHLTKNIKLLEEVQPEYVTDIFFTIASTWIPLDIKKDFICNTLSLRYDSLKISYSAELSYKIENKNITPYIKETEWGTSRRNALKIVEDTLNMKDITVKDEIEQTDGTKKSVKNIQETQAARNMQEKWRMEFVRYIKDNIEIYDSIVKLYNDKFNTDVERKYENILTNLNINPSIHPREHQLIAASRIILNEHNTLLAHSVGSGKTITMVLAAQEMSRIRLATQGKHSKSLIIIPKSLCESGQFAREYLNLYPQAKILATTSSDFSVANRRKLISKMVNFDWDAIIISHSSLAKIPLRKDTEMRMINEDLNELEEVYNFYKKNGDRSSVKRIEKSIKNLEARLKKLNDLPADHGMLYWEELGITNIFIDEAHNFKNLRFPTKLQAAGITATDAQKTQDLYNKLRYFREENGFRGVTFATATPISNSMCELYTLMKYLMLDTLNEKGIGCFDEWASSFGEVTAEIEIDVTGTGFKTRQRFAKFHNLPELMTLFKTVADIVHIENIGDINLPKLKNKKPTIIEIQPSYKMEEYIEHLVERAEKISEGNVDPKVDNMLCVTNDGKKLAVSPRLVGIKEDSLKVNCVVENLLKYLNEDDKTTHVVFCDLGTPKNKDEKKEDKFYWNVYKEIKDKLIDEGIDKNLIALAHDYETPTKRKELFDKFNEGEIRVLIGSTQKLGEGVNVQKHLKTIHHLSVPWRPSDIEQRNGRIIRQGNLNSEVEEFRYVVKRSFDAYSWQTIEIKAKYIEQIMNGDKTIRSIEDMTEGSMSFAETKACACGDNRILELTKLRQEHKKLKFLEKSFNDQKLTIHRRVKENEKIINSLRQRIPELKEDAKIVANALKQRNIINLKGNRYIKDNKLDTDALREDFKKLVYSNDNEGYWGTIYGLDIYYDEFKKMIYIGQSRLLKIKFRKLPNKLLKELLAVKDSIKDLFKNKVEYYNDILHESDELKFKLEKQFEYKDKKDEMEKRINELENILLIDKGNAV